MAKRKPRLNCLLISSPGRGDFLQRALKESVRLFEEEIQITLHYTGENLQTKDGFSEAVDSNDLLLVDFEGISTLIFFEIGNAHGMGKPIVFLAPSISKDELPISIKQNYFVIYHDDQDAEKFSISLKDFFTKYLKTPNRFTQGNLIDSAKNESIIVDLEKLDQRVFENLCFELLSRLGYKQLEWKAKEEFVDAITTLRKQDPDGFEYDELWLISFIKEFNNDTLFDMIIHEPEYFFERIYRDIYRDMLNRTGVIPGKADEPITLLLISRGKADFSRRISKELARRGSRINKRGSSFNIRIRLWDEQNITALVQNNLQLTRKYFSTEALIRSGVRLSYEELYRENADMNEALQKVNQQLIDERSKIEMLERDAAWKLLSFTAAHRLGNPMDAIDSELSNLKKVLAMGKTDMIDTIVQSMETSVENAKSIISEFRNLSKAQEIKPEEINSEKLNDVLRYSAKQAIDEQVKVKFDLKNVPDVSVDVKKLSECFSELVRNALHFLKDDDKLISISVNVSKKTELPEKINREIDYIKIIFADNGLGVPYEKKNEIFKPFATSYIHGTGLGLAYCESVIEKHGGKIREVGKQSEGATFEIFLPVIRNQAKTN